MKYEKPEIVVIGTAVWRSRPIFLQFVTLRRILLGDSKLRSE